ncbi:SDR family NAD(P)-dependent oxidoreductase [Dyadobacter sp. LJ53]|uniref:SDR family NAD(P)-dependent oxidoreductase n=1 Tax=Dyadobacter chenwenxiniae TaxID=2906456 RepID=UPI001F2DB175|nr:SDR family NAD(P)-dependent oxidoreductase [Dyadobacter chenwenxiniae]MCF0051699.1 SDR family NAD(P)-dependent oxidoreductase [Dyadobacter chenwenxiniae]
MKENNDNGKLQYTIGSGFNGTSTANEVIEGINLTGKIAIVTGGGTGIGLETAKTLSEAGATVIVLARDVEKAKINLRGTNGIEVEQLDLTDPIAIDTFAEKFLASGRPLHLLINNAGIMFVPLRRDASGNESQLATNYLSVFRLTARLWEALKQADGARVINISSLGHQFAPFNFEDPNFNLQEYQTLQAYGQSKTAVNLFTLELDNRVRSFGVRAYSVHPGNTWGTELAREAPIEILQQFGFLDDAGNPVQAVINSLKTTSQGAATTVWAATSPLLDETGGVYLEDVDVAKVATDPSILSGVKLYSLDQASAKQLWILTEELLGITFDVI